MDCEWNRFSGGKGVGNYQNFTMKSMKDMKGGEEKILSSPRLTFMLFMSFVVEKPLLLIKTPCSSPDTCI